MTHMFASNAFVAISIDFVIFSIGSMCEIFSKVHTLFKNLQIS